MLVLLLALSGLPADPAFTPWFSERGVEVSIARVPDGIPWIRGRAEIPLSTRQVYAVLVDFAHYRELFEPVVRKAAILDAAGESARLHLVWSAPFPFRDRDAVVGYRGEGAPPAGGAWVLRWKDDARPGDPSEGLRILRVEGETRIEEIGGDRSRVTYTYLGDLGGSLPKFAREKAWRHEPLAYFQALRRRLGLEIPPR